MADINGDGLDDLLTGSFGGLAYVLHGRSERDGNGLRTFESPVALQDLTGAPLCMGMYRAAGSPANAVRKDAKDTRARMLTVVPHDWDGDGDLDLIAGESDGRIVWFENDGSRTEPEFRPEPRRVRAGRRSLWVKEGHSMVTLGDWTGDGRIDVISGSRDGAVFLWSGVAPPLDHVGPAFSKPVELIGPPPSPENDCAETPDAPGTYTQPHLADLDGDGQPELLLGDFRVCPTGDEQSPRKAHGYVWVYRAPR